MNSISRVGTRGGLRGVSALIGATAMLVLAACGSSSNSSSSSSSAGLSKSTTDPNATLIVNNSVPVATLDPGLTTNDQDPGFDGAMYSTLTQVEQVPAKTAGTTEQNLSITAIKPYVAQSWKYSERQPHAHLPLAPRAEVP